MAKTQFKFPPDAGSANAGNTPTRTNCGRGIQRTGDITHIGDNYAAGASNAQTGTLLPGTIGQNVLTPNCDNNPPNGAFDRGFDIQAAPIADASPGTFSGYDGSGEGFDPFSGKQGGQA